MCIRSWFISNKDLIPITRKSRPHYKKNLQFTRTYSIMLKKIVVLAWIHEWWSRRTASTIYLTHWYYCFSLVVFSETEVSYFDALMQMSLLMINYQILVYKCYFQWKYSCNNNFYGFIEWQIRSIFFYSFYTPWTLLIRYVRVQLNRNRCDTFLDTTETNDIFLVIIPYYVSDMFAHKIYCVCRFLLCTFLYQFQSYCRYRLENN